MTAGSSLDQARAVADAVLYEGYLLYPYRSTSSKNRVRWQFGVLGPPEAAETGIGEESGMAADCLLRAGPEGSLSVYVRFLQLQSRTVEALRAGVYSPAEELVAGGARWLTWDEATPCELSLGPLTIADLVEPAVLDVQIPGSHDLEPLSDGSGEIVGRLVRVRRALNAVLVVQATAVDELTRLSLRMDNTAHPQPDKAAAVASSFIGTHLLLEVDDGEFVSTVDPPADARAAAAMCTQQRWWPVLAGPPEENRVLLVSPIIVEDHAELAPESAGALFDSTEIDEILTLRVMTMTDEEKADARATDPRAAEIIDRCDSMTPEQLHELHGVLRSPHGLTDPADLQIFTTDDPPTEVPWWDPAADASVAPESDAVTIAGVRVSKGSLVTVQPSRRADAQDIFFAGMVGKVAAVLNDVDGDTHIAVTLVDDPAADMHDWYGRYLYFAPDELVPIREGETS